MRLVGLTVLIRTFPSPRDAFAAGAFNKVPVLIGGTAHEGHAAVK